MFLEESCEGAQMRRTQLRGQSRGYGAAQAVYAAAVWLLWLLKALAMGAGEALAALYRQLQLLALTLTPGHEYELESDRAGRAAELRVAALCVRLLPSLIFEFFLEYCAVQKI